MNQYYDDINKIVCEFFDRNKLQLQDIFLIGSRASNNNTIHANTDYDSVIIIKDNLELDNLKAIRDNLQGEIKQADKLDLYHFKFFSLDEFEKAKKYDGFRVFEFQLFHKSHLGTTYLSNNSICLDKFNFINSILLQEVNGLLTNPNISKTDFQNEKVKKRVERNNVIIESKKIIPFCDTVNYAEFCKENDILYKEFKELQLSREAYIYFLEKYFVRFRHELINRGKIYLNNLNKI